MLDTHLPGVRQLTLLQVNSCCMCSNMASLGATFPLLTCSLPFRTSAQVSDVLSVVLRMCSEIRMFCKVWVLKKPICSIGKMLAREVLRGAMSIPGVCGLFVAGVLKCSHLQRIGVS